MTLRTEVRAALAEWSAEGVFEPRCDGWSRGFDRAFSRRLADRGWVGVTIPERWGGRGMSTTERFTIAEELLAAGAPVAAHWAGERQVAPMLSRLGTPEQQERFIPKIARAEITFAIGMSEPDSGSDLASVRTGARRTDGGWLLNGSKTWSTGADHADYMLVLCRTSPAGEDRHAGLSQIFVDLGADGVEVRPIPAMGGQGDFCEVFFSDVFASSEDLVGRADAGWQQVMEELRHERSGPERYLSTFPLLATGFDTLRDRAPSTDIALGRILAKLMGLRTLALHSVEGHRSTDSSLDAALCKDAGTVFERDLIEQIRRERNTLGHRSDALDRVLDEAVTIAPAITIRGGTTEILRGIIARGLA